MKPATDAYLALMGLSPKGIPHKEVISNPSLIEYVTGIDPWEKPRTASLVFYDRIGLDMGADIPADDTPIHRPVNDAEVDDVGESRVRWGLTTTTHWNWGAGFASIDQVLSYDVLAHMDLTKANVVESFNYSLEMTRSSPKPIIPIC